MATLARYPADELYVGGRSARTDFRVGPRPPILTVRLLEQHEPDRGTIAIAAKLEAEEGNPLPKGHFSIWDPAKKESLHTAPANHGEAELRAGNLKPGNYSLVVVFVPEDKSEERIVADTGLLKPFVVPGKGTEKVIQYKELHLTIKDATKGESVIFETPAGHKEVAAPPSPFVLEFRPSNSSGAETLVGRDSADVFGLSGREFTFSWVPPAIKGEKAEKDVPLLTIGLALEVGRNGQKQEWYLYHRLKSYTPEPKPSAEQLRLFRKACKDLAGCEVHVYRAKGEDKNLAKIPGEAPVLRFKLGEKP